MDQAVPTRRSLSRRGLLALLGAGAVGVLAACAGGAPAASTPAAETPAPGKPAPGTPAAGTPAAGTPAPAGAATPVPTTGVFSWSGPARPTTTLRFAHFTQAGDDASWWQGNANRFQHLNPDLVITHEPAGWGQYWERMTLFAAGNLMPDVLMMMTAYLPQFITLGALQDLGPYTRLDRTARLDDQWPAFRRLNSIAGKGPYQMHYDLWTYCIYINKDLFKAANVPDPTTRLPDYWTWDEFRAAAIKLTGSVERGGSVYGFGPRLNLWPLADPILRSHGGGVISADNSRCLLDTPESVTVMEQIVELYLKNQAAPAVQDNQLPRLFESGRLAMEIAGLDRAARYRDRIKNFQWDVAPLPVANRTRQKANWVQASGLAIGRTTLQVEGAWRFINFTTSAENLAEMLGKPVRGIPARPSLREMVANSDMAPRQLRLFPDAAEWGICNTVNNFDAFVKLIGPANDALYGGSQPVATIFRELTPQIDALLRPL